MSQYLDVTVVVPIHKAESEDILMLNKALESVSKMSVLPKKVLVVCSPIAFDVVELPSIEFVEVQKVKNTKRHTYQGQFNFAIDVVTTEYISYLEYDDTYAQKWFENVDLYIQNGVGADVYMPLILEVKPDGTPIKYTNDFVWTRDVNEVRGVLDNQGALKADAYILSGSVIKKEALLDVGYMKENIKYSFVYELILRLSHYDKKIQAIPKLGYIHTSMRTGSLSHELHNNGNVDVNILKKWLETAQKEYYFKEDREIILY